MRYGIFGNDGRIESAHNDDTVTQLPGGAVELSETQWDNRFDLLLTSDGLINDPMVLAAAAAVGKSPEEAYEFIAFAKTL